VPVRVRDVGRVHLAPLIRQGAVTRDGRGEIVTGIVMMLVGANGREVVEDVKAKIAQIEPVAAPGVRIDVFYDRGPRQPHDPTVGTNLAEGALFVIGVLFLLLGSIRGGLIVAAAIPFAMLVAFTAMKALGLSGNLMSLGAIDFGIVVDGSIIVVENAVVHLAAAARGRGRPMTYAEAADVVLQSTLDVRKAATVRRGDHRARLRPDPHARGHRGQDVQADGHHGALRAARRVHRIAHVRAGAGGHVPAAAHGGARAVRRAPAPSRLSGLAGWTMKAPVVMGVFARAAGALAGVVASRMGAEFVPRLDEGAIAIQVLRLPSVSLEESVRGATRFEKVLREFPEVVTVVSKTGRAEIATDPMGVELSDAIVILRPPETSGPPRPRARSWSSACPAAHRGAAGPGLLVLAAHRAAHGGAHQRHALRRGDHDLRRRPRHARAPQPGDPGRPSARSRRASDVRGEQLAGLPTLDVTIDRAAASRYGISVRDALDAIEALGGRGVGEVYEGERRFRLQVRVPQSLRDDIDQIRTSR
jgi:cobalt-zinc-cadmium resistance protein CzcA